MSLDVYLKVTQPTTVYSRNITHNLADMAAEAGLYGALWRPEEIGVTHAWQLIPLLQAGLETLEGDPERFKKFAPPNGWGTYDGLVRFVRDYLAACRDNAIAEIEISR